jgi:outer membrane receptor protein involved in Fe transport
MLSFRASGLVLRTLSNVHPLTRRISAPGTLRNRYHVCSKNFSATSRALRRNGENSDVNAGRPGYEFFDSVFFAIDAPFSEDVGVDPGFSSNAPAHLATNVRKWRSWNVGAYFNDDWKISRRLTLNLGIRYDVYTSGIETNGLATTFKKGPGSNFIDNITTGAGQI